VESRLRRQVLIPQCALLVLDEITGDESGLPRSWRTGEKWMVAAPFF